MNREEMNQLFDLAKTPPDLSKIDQQRSVTQELYKSRMKDYQLKLLNLQRRLIDTQKSLIIVIEGPDAAGKGGAIKRVTEKLDPRNLRVYSIIKPSTEEYQHHYMWRFWNKVPAHGQVAIFDRSWYGRVLVERVENFATKEEWRRAYREINEFERLLVDGGAAIVKLFLMIDKEEQLNRFKQREADPYKHWKISEEDWRNRRAWDAHIEAAQQMFDLTSTQIAPWHLIPANFKWFARLETIRLVVKSLEALDLPK